MGEVLEFEAEGDVGRFSDERRADIREVLNYRSALRESEWRWRTCPCRSG